MTYLGPRLDEELGIGLGVDLVLLPVLDTVPETHTSGREQT